MWPYRWHIHLLMCVLFLAAHPKKSKILIINNIKQPKRSKPLHQRRRWQTRQTRLPSALITSGRHLGRVTTGGAARYRNSSWGPMRRRASNTGAMMQRCVKDGAQQEHPAARRGPVPPSPLPLGASLWSGGSDSAFIRGCNVTTRWLRGSPRR